MLLAFGRVGQEARGEFYGGGEERGRRRNIVQLKIRRGNGNWVFCSSWIRRLTLTVKVTRVDDTASGKGDQGAQHQDFDNHLELHGGDAVLIIDEDFLLLLLVAS